MAFDFGKAWETAKKVAMNVATAGGYSAVQKSIELHEKAIERHGNSVRAFEEANSKFQAAVETLGTESQSCIRLLEDVNDFVKLLSQSRLSSDIPNAPYYQPPDLSEVTKTIFEFNAALESGKGAGMGAAVSTGAWLLVAHLGTASTGAAIGGLTGAAAHNAVLAWFGGGAVAAGGGGMVLGGIALGAITLLPLIGYSAYKSYKEAFRIDNETAKVQHSDRENKGNATKLHSLAESATQLECEIRTKRGAFLGTIEGIYQRAHALADETRCEANAFAEYLLNSAKAKGASA
jgi:membrane protein implicated in regulation of membrane protease activity